jgi:hypothetical protein
MYKINQSELNDKYNICIIDSNVYIPIDPANSDYQRVLNDIIEQGADCFEGDIPEELQDAADTKQFAQQLESYTTATARLAQYVLSVGRAEVTENLATGEKVWNEETLQMDAVMADFIIVTAIDALDATVEQTTYDEEGVATTSTVENPLITVDVAERATAQAIVDATPSAVVDTYNA